MRGIINLLAAISNIVRGKSKAAKRHPNTLYGKGYNGDALHKADPFDPRERYIEDFRPNP